MDENSGSGAQSMSSSNSHLDFVTCWTDRTVEREILRGHQLRELKPQALPKRSYDVVNMTYDGSPSTKGGSYRRKKSRGACAKCCKQRSSSPPKSEAIPQKYRRQNKKKLQCSMRIAELAVPSKRQCLDAWRRNYDKLPPNMVESLRQYILDQKPVVEVAEAVHYFKRKKTINKGKGERKKSLEKVVARLKKPLNSSDIKTLSAIFGHKIAKNLSIPLIIELNSDLEKIANVVSLEIYELMRKSKKVNTRSKVYKNMHLDVTKKVTIWVADILEEASYKILEEQYKEFEEEAGPVFFFIDELIDNIVSIGKPDSDKVEVVWSEPRSSEGFEEALEDVQAPIESEMIEEIIEDHVQSELIGIIDSVIKYIDINSDDKLHTNDVGQIDDTKKFSDVLIDVENNDNKDVHDAFIDVKNNTTENEPDRFINDENKTTKSEPDLFMKVENNTTKTESLVFIDVQNNAAKTEHDVFTDVQNNVITTEPDVVMIVQNNTTKTESDDFMDLENNAEIQHSEFADAYDKFEEKRVTKDDSQSNDNQNGKTIGLEFMTNNHEEDNKKVKFYKDGNTIDSKSGERENSQKASAKSSLAHIEFGLPNEVLLSYADELWPANVQLPLIRPSASANKSITSLGRILEDEEKSVLNDESGNDLNRATNSDSVDKEISNADESWPVDVQLPKTRPSETITSLGRIPDDEVKSVQMNDDENNKSITNPDDTDKEKSNEDERPADQQPLVIRPSDNKSITSLERIVDNEKNVLKDRDGNGLEGSTNSNDVDKENLHSEQTIELSKDQKRQKLSQREPRIKEKGKTEEQEVTIENKSTDKSPRDKKNSILKERTRPKEKRNPERKSTSLAINPNIKTKATQKPKSEKHIGVKNIVKAHNPIETLVKKRSTGKEKSIDSVATSKSSKDLSDDRMENTKKILSFSRVVKPDYRVNVNTAPSWVTRTYGELSCVSIDMNPHTKAIHECSCNSDIRKWARELDKSLENLKLWNEWIDNTSRTFHLLQQEISRIVSCDGNKKAKSKLLELKTNLDRDAILWRKLRKCTQERLHSYRNIYQIPKYRDNKFGCTPPIVFEITVLPVLYIFFPYAMPYLAVWKRLFLQWLLFFVIVFEIFMYYVVLIKHYNQLTCAILK